MELPPELTRHSVRKPLVQQHLGQYSFTADSVHSKPTQKGYRQQKKKEKERRFRQHKHVIEERMRLQQAGQQTQVQHKAPITPQSMTPETTKNTNKPSVQLQQRDLLRAVRVFASIESCGWYFENRLVRYRRVLQSFDKVYGRIQPMRPKSRLHSLQWTTIDSKDNQADSTRLRKWMKPAEVNKLALEVMPRWRRRQERIQKRRQQLCKDWLKSPEGIRSTLRAIDFEEQRKARSVFESKFNPSWSNL